MRRSLISSVYETLRSYFDYLELTDGNNVGLTREQLVAHRLKLGALRNKSDLQATFRHLTKFQSLDCGGTYAALRAAAPVGFGVSFACYSDGHHSLARSIHSLRGF